VQGVEFQENPLHGSQDTAEYVHSSEREVPLVVDRLHTGKRNQLWDSFLLWHTPVVANVSAEISW